MSGRDEDRRALNLHDNPDAQAWAKEFCGMYSVYTEDGVVQDKEGLMIGWFANAMMAMHDTCHRAQSPPASACPRCGEVQSNPDWPHTCTPASAARTPEETAEIKQLLEDNQRATDAFAEAVHRHPASAGLEEAIAVMDETIKQYLHPNEDYDDTWWQTIKAALQAQPVGVVTKRALHDVVIAVASGLIGLDAGVDRLNALVARPRADGGERCAACDEAARHAYSGATTPGFFHDKCQNHRAAMGKEKP